MASMEVIEVLLPGVGLRYELSTASGARLGIIARRDGSFELVRYHRADPDAGVHLVTPTREEADTVGEILGAPRITERFADLTKEVPGLASATVDIPPGSPFAGSTLGATRARTRTGASVVAIVRGEHVIASPTPRDGLLAGDSLVVVGTDAGIAAVRQLIGG